MENKDYSDFNVVEFLEDNNIYYRTSGENIGRGWIGVNCPFPFCASTKEHCGINLTSKCFSCFQCGEKGSPVKLIKQLLNVSWSKAYYIIDKYSGRPDKNIPLVPSRESTVSEVELPPFRSQLLGPGGEYLRSRGFDPQYIEEIYGVTETGPVGDYNYRLIIPIIMNNQLLSFTARDYTDRAKPKYKESSPAKSVRAPKDCIYNIDRVQEHCLYLEGSTDVWRMGDGAVCGFGIKLTKKQLELLYYLSVERKTLKKFIIMLDPKTEKATKAICSAVASFLPVQVVDLFDKDPGEFTDQEAMNLKLQLFR